MSRFTRRDELAARDPETDYEAIYRDLATLEMPWDLNQSLSLALFRTYAVPSIGQLLAQTGELVDRVQKRYDDTVLVLDAVLEHGQASPAGRDAVRRMNQMHGAHDISTADMRYVLATFVVVPARWMADFGWRALTPTELRASVLYYRHLGLLMGITAVPGTYAEFERVLTDTEDGRFGFSPGGRAVADATLDLMTTFPPNRLAPKPLVRAFSRGLMDDALLAALHYRRPPAPLRHAARAAMVLRARVERWMPVRTRPKLGRELPQIRSYPDGYAVSELGTFGPCTCPRPEGG